MARGGARGRGKRSNEASQVDGEKDVLSENNSLLKSAFSCYGKSNLASTTWTKLITIISCGKVFFSSVI